MPFEIVRNDITNMQVDAIVNPASRGVRVNPGVDMAIHKKAGPQLLQARGVIGDIAVGDAAITPGFGLDAGYVIHAPSPLWINGKSGEVNLLLKTYYRCLNLAVENGCESIAFPLLASGNKGFPKQMAIQTAVHAFSSFLMDHDIHIYLVVFGKESFVLSEKLVQNVASYIDEHYVDAYEEEIYFDQGARARRARYERSRAAELRRQSEKRRQSEQFRKIEKRSMDAPWDDELASPMAMECESVGMVPEACESVGMVPEAVKPADLKEFLMQRDAGFAVTLVDLIKRSGKKNSEIYKKANIDKKLFSKIINNVKYHPSKQTAIAFAIALELDMAETQDLIGRAGYRLTRSSRFDLIIEYCIIHKIYNIFEVNEILFEFDEVLLGY